MIRRLLLILLAALLVACGSESNDPTPSVTPSDAANTATSPTPNYAAPATTVARNPSPAAEQGSPQPTAEQSRVWQIAFASSGLRNPNDGHEQISLVNANGDDLVNLTNQPGNHRSPAWSPDGRQIAFVSDREGYLELYVMDADGTNLRRITNNEFAKEAPAWSPDGNALVFACFPTREAGGQADSQICTVNVDGSDFRNLSEGNVHGYDPVWSPVDRRIAFVGSGPDRFDQIYVVDSDGSNLRQLTDDPLGSSTSPDWSPDGRRLAYTGASGEGPQIHIVDVESGEILKLTSVSGRNDHAPDWSPDGKQIAFVAEGTTIMVVNADDSSSREIAQEGRSLGPAWAPDGSRIAFLTVDANPPALIVVRPDGSNLTIAAHAVSTGSPTETPAWRPYPADSGAMPPAATPVPEPTSPGADVPTLEEIYARARESLQRPGMLYHATVTLTSDAGLYSQVGTVEQWVDVADNVSRLELALTFTEAPEAETFDVTQIVEEGLMYSVYRTPEQRTDTTDANTCYATNEAVGAVLGCPGFTEESTTTVEHGEYEGKPAIVLVTTGTSHGSDESTTFISRLYLDAETYLPIAKETEGTLNYGETVPLQMREIYQHNFVPRDAVPADFFDTSALAREQLDAVPQPGFTVYWLGMAFDPGNDLPRLVLGSAGRPGYPDASYDLLIDYRLEDVRLTPNGAPVIEVVIQEWSSSVWHAEWESIVRGYWGGQECHDQLEVETPHGQATIFMGYGHVAAPPDPGYGIATPPANINPGCVDPQFTRYEAIAYMGGTALFIYVPEDSTYASRAGIEAIVQGLLPRDTP